MNKEDKAELVANLNQGFRRSSLTLVSESRAITAAESAEMRKRLRAVRGELHVAKNTLIRRALEDTACAGLKDQLGGPVGIILSFEDPIAVAKAVAGFSTLGDRFKIRAGVLEGKPLTAEEISALAALPPREVVLAQLLGLLSAPATRLVRLLNEPGAGVARLAAAIGRRAEKSEGGAA